MFKKIWEFFFPPRKKPNAADYPVCYDNAPGVDERASVDLYKRQVNYDPS